MSSNTFFSLLDTTVREGQRFSESFFKLLDTRDAPQSITPQTTIVWNGSPLVGRKAFSEMLLASPLTKHEITGLDVHPFPNGDQHALNMIVTLSGRVYYGDHVHDNLFAFSAQIVVRRPDARTPLALQTMAYRLVHKPANTKLQIPVA